MPNTPVARKNRYRGPSGRSGYDGMPVPRALPWAELSRAFSPASSSGDGRGNRLRRLNGRDGFARTATLWVSNSLVRAGGLKSRMGRPWVARDFNPGRRCAGILSREDTEPLRILPRDDTHSPP